MSAIKAIVYLPLDPEKAKENNLPVKLPVLVEDLPRILDENRIPLDVVLRGLESQYEVSKDEYYGSYYVFFLYEKFKLLLREGDFEEAEKVLQKAKSVLYDYRYHFYKGLLHKHKRELGEAEVEMRLAVSMREDFAPAYFELANVLREKGEIEDSLKFYEIANEIDKDFLLPLLVKGDTLLQEGRLIEAMAEYQRVIERDPNFAEAYARLGVIHNQLQRFKEAERYLRKALELGEKDDVKLNLAYTLTKLGKLFEAFRILKELYEKNPDDPLVANEYGLMLKTLGLYEEALEVFERAASTHREEEILKFNYGVLLLHFDKERAVEVLSEVTGDLEERAQHLIELAQVRFVPVLFPEHEWITDYLANGRLDIVALAQDMNSSIEEVQKRIERIRKGEFPFYETDVDSSEFAEIVVALAFSSPDLFKMEENVVKFLSAVYGNSAMIAGGIVFVRLVQELLLAEELDFGSFLKRVVPEVQDVNWSFALKVARFRDLKKLDVGRFTDLVIALLQSLEVGAPVLKDRELTAIFDELKRLRGRCDDV